MTDGDPTRAGQPFTSPAAPPSLPRPELEMYVDTPNVKISQRFAEKTGMVGSPRGEAETPTDTEIIDALSAASQLFSGWHYDGLWGEYDESVRRKVQRVLNKLRQRPMPTNPLSPETPITKEAIMETRPEETREEHLLGWAWSIIANASGGDWTKQTPEWREAAAKWRDELHSQPVTGLNR